MRLVLDSDVFIAGVRSRLGASRLMLESGLRSRFAWLVSPALFLEYEAVLLRQETLSDAGLSPAEARDLLSGVAAVVEPVAIDFLWRPQLTDPGDEMVLEAAVNGLADFLVSFNQRHFHGAATRFRLETSLPGDLLIRYPEVFR